MNGGPWDKGEELVKGKCNSTTIQPGYQRAKNSNRCMSKEDIPMDTCHRKTIGIAEMPINAPLQYHFTLTGVPISSDNTEDDDCQPGGGEGTGGW